MSDYTIYLPVRKSDGWVEYAYVEWQFESIPTEDPHRISDDFEWRPFRIVPVEVVDENERYQLTLDENSTPVFRYLKQEEV